jgi:hypothetical protein
MTLEDRILNLEQQLQQAILNERQAFEIRLRTEGALISLRQLLEDERKAQADEQTNTPA